MKPDFGVVTVSPLHPKSACPQNAVFSTFWKEKRGGCGRRAERPAIPGHRSAGVPAPL